MTTIRVRLDDEDRKRYGDGDPLPEQLVFDTEKLKDLPFAELYELEREMDLAIASVTPLFEAPLSKQAIVRQVVAYLAVRQAGQKVTFEDFQPRLLRAEFVHEEAEAGPPAGPSGGSSEG